MVNGYTDSLNNSETLTNSSNTTTAVMDENNRENQSTDENEQSMEEDDSVLSDQIPKSDGLSTRSNSNPFVNIIDRKTDILDTSEKQQQHQQQKLTSTPDSGIASRIGSTSGSSNTSMGFQSNEFVTPGPNPIRIPPDDFMNTLMGFNNMYLAHEISINPDFKLERFAPPQDSLEYRIQHQLKRAFWDVFEEQLNVQPPNYNQALSIFEEMKTMLLSLLMPHNHSMRQRINEVLDVDLIRQQVQHDALDFSKYAEFIIGILSQLCAPSRDEEITHLRTLTKPTEIFQGILELMEKMKLDMANFYIQQSKSIISANCLQYERKKFSDFLDLEFRLQQDGLRNTRKWLLKHRTEQSTNVLIKAFVDLLNWTEEENRDWPETLVLDAIRLVKIGVGVKRLSIIGGIVLTSETLCQTLLSVAASDLRQKLKSQLEILITNEDVGNDKKVEECLDRVSEQVIKIMNDVLFANKNRTLADTEKETIRNSIKDLANGDHKIRTLLVRRSLEYAESCLINGKNSQLPSGLNSIGTEITLLMRDFCRIVLYNRAVFDCVYVILLEDQNSSLDNMNEWSSVEKSLESILKVLSPKDISEQQQQHQEQQQSKKI